KEGTLSQHRLVVVRRDACASDWISASRMAGACRSLHILAADRSLHCDYLGRNRFGSLVAVSTDRSWRCWPHRSWNFELARLAANILLARQRDVVYSRACRYQQQRCCPE